MGKRFSHRGGFLDPLTWCHMGSNSGFNRERVNTEFRER